MDSFFDYFQILSGALFLLILLVKTFHLRFTSNINPIAIGGGKRGLALAVELIAFTGLAIWLAEVLLYALHSSFHLFPTSLNIQLIDSFVAKVVGVVLVSVGLLIFLSAYISFGDSWRVGFDVKSPGALVTTGVFRYSRNPIYLFLNLWFLGTFLINGRLVFLIFAVMTAVVVHWQILQEEAFLLRLYGKPYEDYCARTGRYFTTEF